MIFKEDWEECKERFDAFWAGENTERCLISVTAPRDKPLIAPEDRHPRDLREKWLSTAYRHSHALYQFANTYFGAEAIPNFQINLGPGVVAAFMGADYELHDITVWFGQQKHLLSKWDDIDKIKFNENSELWKIAIEMAEYFLTRADGDYLLCSTDLGGTLDIAASFRGTEQLLTDLYDYPDEVKALCNKIDNIWLSCYDKIQDMTNKYQEGSVDWYPTWYRGKRTYAVQCDFAAMISPDQFREFAVPSLIKQTKTMDKAIYHLDGPGQIPHLDTLLEIDSIDGIQWVPGSGNSSGCSEVWYPLYKKIQDKGKKLIITCIDNAEIGKLLENISPRGVMLGWVNCDTEDEAKELIKFAARNTKQIRGQI